MEALIVVDMQNDYLDGGAVATPDGHARIEAINLLMDRFDLVAASQDWHPAEHFSFAENHDGRAPGDVVSIDGRQWHLWPAHCVRNTPGAEFCRELNTERFRRVFQTGTDAQSVSHSAFGEGSGSGLAEWLRERRVDSVAVCGVAIEAGVRETVLDALREGFRTRLIVTACSGGPCAGRDEPRH